MCTWVFVETLIRRRAAYTLPLKSTSGTPPEQVTDARLEDSSSQHEKCTKMHPFTQNAIKIFWEGGTVPHISPQWQRDTPLKFLPIPLPRLHPRLGGEHLFPEPTRSAATTCTCDNIALILLLVWTGPMGSRQTYMRRRQVLHD